MTNLKKLTHLFSPYAVPEELRLLLEFQKKHGEESYSEGFALTDDGKEGLKLGWSDDQDFLNELIPFAQANGTGSTYAIWINKKSDDVASLPVVIFGDEGGQHIIAENLRDLLKILTYDSEPMVDHEEVSFYKDEDDHEASEFSEEFHQWLNDNFQITSVEDPYEIIEKAQADLQDEFNEWISQYLPEEDYNDEDEDDFDDEDEDDSDDDNDNTKK